jgi:hypothetical protein
MEVSAITVIATLGADRQLPQGAEKIGDKR